MRLLFQVCAWLGLAAIGALSLVAPSMRPVTVLPHNLEHAAIFALTGVAVGLGYPRHAARNMIALAIFAAVVELAQIYVPGRHARVIDFLVDASAACVGIALVWIVSRAVR